MNFAYYYNPFGYIADYTLGVISIFCQIYKLHLSKQPGSYGLLCSLHNKTGMAMATPIIPAIISHLSNV